MTSSSPEPICASAGLQRFVGAVAAGSSGSSMGKQQRHGEAATSSSGGISKQEQLEEGMGGRGGRGPVAVMAHGAQRGLAQMGAGQGRESWRGVAELRLAGGGRRLGGSSCSGNWGFCLFSLGIYK